MSGRSVAFHWKLTALVKPADGQECLVYNPCDGYRVAEWDADDHAFHEHAGVVGDHLAVFWMELPSALEMCQMEQRIACQAVPVTQVVAREMPAILRSRE